MKNVSVFLTGMFIFLMSFTVKAQEAPKADYFVGKWSVLVEGTPQGDAINAVVFERKDGKLTGSILSPGKAAPAIFSRVMEKEKSVTAYFSASGYDVYLVLDKVDDNSATGSMMDMFDAKATRVVVEK